MDGHCMVPVICCTVVDEPSKPSSGKLYHSTSGHAGLPVGCHSTWLLLCNPTTHAHTRALVHVHTHTLNECSLFNIYNLHFCEAVKLHLPDTESDRLHSAGGKGREATSAVWKWFGYKDQIQQTTVMCKNCNKTVTTKEANTAACSFTTRGSRAQNPSSRAQHAFCYIVSIVIITEIP